MVYKRYIYRNGKRFGPYYYHTYRDKEGKTHSRYVQEQSKDRAVTPKPKFYNTFKQHKTLFILLAAIFAIFLVIIVLGNQASKQEGISSRDQGEFGFKKIADNVKSFVTGLTSDTPEEPAPGTIDEAPIETPAETTPEQPIETTTEEETTNETQEEPEQNDTEQVTNETITQPETNQTTSNNESASNETSVPVTSSNESSESSEGIISNVTNQTIENETIGNVTETLNETNFTIITNETNITLVNETVNVTTFVSTNQFGAILGKPVRWEKKITLDIQGANSTRDLIIDLPKEAGNISVKKSRDGVDEEVQAFVINEKKIEEIEPTKRVEDLQEDTEGSRNFLTGAFNFVLGFFRSMTARVVGEATGEEVLVEVSEEIYESEEIVIEYYTDPPYSIEENLDNGKRVRVIGVEETHYENVLAFTELNESLGVKDPSGILIYWNENATYVPLQNINDLNSNGIYDYVEWIVPHLSNQTFDIIVITKAEHLDENKTFISDIYNEVKELDGVWSEEIPEGHYVRVTFERNLTLDKDITVYPRIISGNPRIEVYEQDGNDIVAQFSNLNSNNYNKVYLNSLQGSQDTFDLKVLDGSVEFDYIVDPVTIATYYPNGTNQNAYKGGDATAPPAGAYTNALTSLSSAELNNISLSDNERAIVSYTVPIWNIHEVLFKISESASTINNITFTWEGYNTLGAEAPTTNDLRLYVYNHTGSTWGAERNTTCANSACNSAANEKTVTFVISSSISDFINSTGHIRFMATEWDDELLCPFVYSWNGTDYVFDNFVIKGLQGKDKENLQFSELENYIIKDGNLDLQIREEIDETSYLDLIYLVVNDTKDDSWITYNLYPKYIIKNSTSQDLDLVLISDDNYLITGYGDVLDLRFENIPSLINGYNRSLFMAVEGYWDYNNSENEFRDIKLTASKKKTHNTLYTDLMKIDVNYNASSDTAPQWSLNSTNSTSKNTAVIHNVYWIDDNALSGYIFSFDNGIGTFTNDSFVSMVGAGNWSNVTKVINSTNGATIRWIVYANDSANQWNVTSTFSYLTTNDAPTQTNPVYSLSPLYNTLNATCLNQSTSDPNQDSVTNIYNWLINGSSLMLLNLPFDTNVSDAGGNIKDYSGNNNNFTLNVSSGTPKWMSNGRIGGAYLFDGVDDSMNSTNTVDLSGINKITVSFWVKPNTTSTGADILLEMSPNFNSYTDSFIVFFREDEAIEASLEGDYQYNTWISTSTLSSGTWTFLTATFDTSLSSNESKLYFNGVLDGANDPAHNYDNTNNFGNRTIYIGARAGTDLYFNGSIDDVRIYNRSLSAAQIYQLYLDTKNGYSNSSTLVTNEFTLGNNLTCQITPNDALNDGTMESNSSSIIGDPSIAAYTPITDNFSIAEPSNQTFNIASTGNSTPIYIKWFVNGTEQIDSRNSSQYIWLGNYSQEGAYQIKVNISNAYGEDDQIWIMAVNDTDIFSPTVNLLAPTNNSDNDISTTLNLSCNVTDVNNMTLNNISNVSWYTNRRKGIWELAKTNSTGGATSAVYNYSFIPKREYYDGLQYCDLDNSLVNNSNRAMKMFNSSGFWVFASYQTDRVYILNSTCGNVNNWASPDTNIRDVYSNGTFIWLADWLSSTIYIQDSSGNNIGNYVLPDVVWGIDSNDNGQTLWWTNYSAGTGATFIHIWSMNGTEISRFGAGRPLNNLYLAVSNTTLWTLDIYNNPDQITEYDLATGVNTYNISLMNISVGGTTETIQGLAKDFNDNTIDRIYTTHTGVNELTAIERNTTGAITWNCYACDIYSNCAFNATNWSYNYGSAFSVAIDLSPWLTQQVNWSLTSLPANNQSAEGNNGTGITLYWVNVSVTGGSADLYMKANDNLTSPGGDKILLGNESYSYNTTNNTVPSDTKTPLTTSYSSHLIGDNLPEGNTLVYLKFFLSAPSSQPAGTYNNTPQFKAVEDGQSP